MIVQRRCHIREWGRRARHLKLLYIYIYIPILCVYVYSYIVYVYSYIVYVYSYIILVHAPCFTMHVLYSISVVVAHATIIVYCIYFLKEREGTEDISH